MGRIFGIDCKSFKEIIKDKGLLFATQPFLKSIVIINSVFYLFLYKKLSEIIGTQ